MLYKEANSCVCVNFNEDYFRLHGWIYSSGQVVESRNGLTRELLSFKTTITNPTQRCIGGYHRNMNIYFLLAEALWIFAGRKDVKFLDIFNSNMKSYSDDGISFHAPYGWRMRNYGPTSFDYINEHAVLRKDAILKGRGVDQLQVALNMLASNHEDRRVVVSLWNTFLDLATISKDLPCNDLLMFIIRKNEFNQEALYLDIANRSNDLNLGLTTNVFQFSFILEIMASILGVEVGRQTHNSRSLHLYMAHETTSEMQRNILAELTGKENQPVNLYHDATNLRMDFDFHGIPNNPTDRLNVIDMHIKNIIAMLLNINSDQQELNNDLNLFEENLQHFSKFLHQVYYLLKIYVLYKKHKNKKTAVNHITNLPQVFKHISEDSDLYVLALNFFVKRLRDQFTLSEFEDYKASLFVNKNNPNIKNIFRNLGKY